MMKFLKTTILAVLALLPAAAFAQVAPSGNPGIVVAGSVNDAAVPQAAKDFINKYYPGQSLSLIHI